MHIYKFRMLYAENEDFVRDYEIQATQTFLDFHRIIVETTGLDARELSSFHICDQKWNKLKEITLIDMMAGEPPENEDEPPLVEEVTLMESSVIRDFINEPRQRLLFEHDFLNMKTFFIELSSVYKQKEEAEFPRCVFSRGQIIQPVTDSAVGDVIEEDDEAKRDLIRDIEDFQDLGDLGDFDNFDDLLDGTIDESLDDSF
ncbi:MAG: hypothetical protein Kow00127_00410 [Bacteroidales bacterium]